MAGHSTSKAPEIPDGAGRRLEICTWTRTYPRELARERESENSPGDILSRRAEPGEDETSCLAAWQKVLTSRALTQQEPKPEMPLRDASTSKRKSPADGSPAGMTSVMCSSTK